jgi:hypothetical protein
MHGVTDVKLIVRNLYFLKTIHNTFVFVDSNSCNSVTIQNYTHVHKDLSFSK